jgi:hypothetical protein
MIIQSGIAPAFSTRKPPRGTDRLFVRNRKRRPDFLSGRSAGVYDCGLAAMHQKGKKRARFWTQLYWHLGVFSKWLLLRELDDRLWTRPGSDHLVFTRWIRTVAAVGFGAELGQRQPIKTGTI